MSNYYDKHTLSESSQWRDIVSSAHAVRVLRDKVGEIGRRYFEPGRKIRWVDVGCGLGAASEAASYLGYAYTGIDSSSKHVTECRRRYPGSSFNCDDWLSHQGEYEIATFISSLHHFPDWHAALEKAYSVVVKGGIILVDHEPNRLYSKLFRFYSVYVRRVDPELVGSVEIHWFNKPSILPEDLPLGETEYHCDFFPFLGRLGIRTNKPFPGRFLEAYRKILIK
ncbi:MAG: class I SAM-dependent methyltransferase, partial [Elusimicrobia bacterium]|nr:class I SAM-dependent methyltransferase [Elusimicrobiota bacterium]